MGENLHINIFGNPLNVLATILVKLLSVADEKMYSIILCYTESFLQFLKDITKLLLSLQ